MGETQMLGKHYYFSSSWLYLYKLNLAGEQPHIEGFIVIISVPNLTHYEVTKSNYISLPGTFY
jgi:hypothetical protein